MSAFKLTIVSPSGKVFEGTIEALTAPGLEGSFGVLAGHAPMVSSLTRGVISLKQSGTEKFFAVNSGILEVDHEHSVLILASEINEETSREAAQKNATALPVD